MLASDVYQAPNYREYSKVLKANSSLSIAHYDRGGSQKCFIYKKDLAYSLVDFSYFMKNFEEMYCAIPDKIEKYNLSFN